ncbi:MAG TPA: hypothetical protein VHL59_07935 [Thermoanaerobaculia bacterium]|nr:hypothetical protein [Thermoanaerobaculia bacterium]
MNVADERAYAVRALTGARVDVPWRTYGLLAQVVFFGLTLIGVAALYFLCEEMKLPGGVVTMLLSIALAEYLIHVRRWFRTGVESALWIGGLFCVVVDLPGPPRDEGLLLFAAAAAIAGARVRNPLFGALAAGFVVHYAEKRFDAGVLAALAFAALAVLALCREWRRPSNEWLFIAIALILPLVGYAEADPQWRATTIALYAAFGVLALTLAIVKRHHALFFAATIGFAIAGVEIARAIDVPLEAKLAAGGALLLLLALIVARLLRDRTDGFVMKEESVTGDGELLEIAAMTAATPSQNLPEGRPRGGGGFGGAGATGDL